jgi:NTP pyrophosphatase (non-canonical NTP hydrolase)
VQDDRLESLMAELRAFVAARDWRKFHDPKNLSMLLASEVGELLALFRWIDNADADAFAADPKHRAKIEAEVADATIGVLLLCDRLGIDPIANARAKLAQNAKNYPADVVRGTAERPPRS